MIYAVDITTLKSTTVLSPKRTVLNVTKGLVYRVHFQFPKGSAGLLGVAVFKGGFQVWPSTRDHWFRGDDNVIAFDDTYLVNSDPSQFVIHTYNTDDTYDHEVLIRIGLVSANIFMARFLPSYAYAEYRRILSDLETKQKEERELVLSEMFPLLR